MQPDFLTIKRKVPTEPAPTDTYPKGIKTFGEAVLNVPAKPALPRLLMPEINTDEVFQKILEDANNDISIYKILTSALHLCRTELVILSGSKGGLLAEEKEPNETVKSARRNLQRAFESN